MKSLLVSIQLFWLKVRDWFNWELCPKERAGYNCHHRTMSNGKKECGY